MTRASNQIERERSSFILHIVSLLETFSYKKHFVLISHRFWKIIIAQVMAKASSIELEYSYSPHDVKVRFAQGT